jgi:Restriction endonuclease
MKPRNVAREVSQLTDFGFEAYVADRFTAIPGWKGEETQQSKDQGIDVRVTSPNGKKYAVQCKKVAAKLGSPECQKTVGGGHFYGVPPENCILLSALPGPTDKAFTPEAEKYAKATGLKLWTLEQLQVLANAEVMQDDAPLAALGLEIGLQTSIPQSPKIRSRWLWPAIIGAISLTAVTAFALPTLKANLEIRRLLEQHDALYIQANAVGDISLLEPVTLGQAYSIQAQRIADRNLKGCLVETQIIEPSKVLEISVKGETAVARMWKHWQFTKHCTGQPDDPMTEEDGAFTMRYTLRLMDGAWFVTARDLE